MWGLIPPHTCHNNLPLKCESSIHHAPPQAETFSSIHVHLRWPHSEDSPPDHLCREDFWYKETIELFVELYIGSDTTVGSRGGHVRGEFFFPCQICCARVRLLRVRIWFIRHHFPRGVVVGLGCYCWLSSNSSLSSLVVAVVTVLC
jgi:hypothetical protein